MSDIRYNNEFCIVRENGTNTVVLSELLSGRVETAQQIEKIIPSDNSLMITGLSGEETDLILNNLSNNSGAIETVWLEDAPRTYASNDVVNKLTERGVTIITVKS